MMNERDKAMRAARDHILRRVGEWLGTNGFIRTGTGHFTQPHGDVVCHIGFQKHTSGRAVRVTCHITSGNDHDSTVMGPWSDAYERPQSPNKKKYRLSWSTREADIARCVTEYCNYLDEVVLPWFREQLANNGRGKRQSI